MKLVNLQLLAYGCFTDHTLDFSRDDRSFHVIFGGNEAGKSTALRALTGLFYGIHARTTDTFLHEAKRLRIGAVLRRSDGQELTCVRRKGNRDTLLGGDEEPISEKCLADFLGGIPQEIFDSMFRLDHPSLVRGGDELLAGKGDLAESLFQAGAGITGLRKTLQELDAEADLLFKPRSSVAILNRAIDDYDQARKRSRDAAVPPKLWTELHDRHQANQAELVQIRSELAKANSHKERLGRWQMALPHVTRLTQLRNERTSLPSVRVLAPDVTERRIQTKRSLDDSARRMDDAVRKLNDLGQDANQHTPPRELLDHAERIRDILTRLEAYRLASRDLPKVQAERQQLEEQAESLLAEIQPDLPLSAADSLRVTAQQRARIRSLADRFHVLQERVQNSMRRCRSAETQLKQAHESLEKFPVPPDGAALAQAFERVRGLGDLDDQRDSELDAAKELERKAELDLRRLTLWSGTLEQLRALPVPASEVIEGYETELQELHARETTLLQRLDENQQRAQQFENSLQTLQLGDEVPTEQHLVEVRTRRESAWQQLKLTGSHATGKSRATDVRALEEDFEKLVAHADLLADRLRREADRVARVTAVLAEQATCRRRAEEIAAQRNQWLNDQQEWQRRWTELWLPVGIEPKSPREMRAWLKRHLAIVETGTQIDQHRTAAQRISRRIEAARSELVAAMREPVEPDLSLAALVSHAHAQVESTRQAILQRKNLEKDLQRAVAEAQAARAEVALGEQELEQWHTDWHAAIASLQLPPDAGVPEVTAVLANLDQLFEHLKDSRNRLGRVQDMELHIAQFQSDVDTAVSLAAPQLRELPCEQAVLRLRSLLEEAQSSKITRSNLEKQTSDTQKLLDRATQEHRKARRDWEDLLVETGCQSIEELVELERQSALARALENQIAAVEEDLARSAGGASLDEFLKEVSAVQADSIPFELQEIERQLEQLDQRRSELLDQIGAERSALAAMDGSDVAASAAEDAQSALAQVREATEQYLRFRLASQVLRLHIERYREQNQDPIIKRAAEIFPQLTRGSFARLKTGFDEKDRPVLLGVRPNGEEVPVTGMSDGTRDQLFLSLRLASLERQLAAAEPIPLVLDDVLIQFDDDRASATLEQLAAIAKRTQILFFTHHDRLVELARRIVPDSVLEVHRLTQ